MHKNETKTIIKSQWIKDLNVSHKTIKILERNIGSKISGISCSNIFANTYPRARASHMFRYDPSTLTLLRVFIINGCWISSDAFSASVDIMWFYLSFSLCGKSHLWICEYVPTLRSWDKSHLNMVCDIFTALLHPVC